MEEMMIFSVSILGALGALLSVVFKSKCKKISCCFGAFSCDRDVRAVIEEEKLEMGKTPTPRRSDRIKEKEITLQNLEPEAEEESA